MFAQYELLTACLFYMLCSAGSAQPPTLFQLSPTEKMSRAKACFMCALECRRSERLQQDGCARTAAANHPRVHPDDVHHLVGLEPPRVSSYRLDERCNALGPLRANALRCNAGAREVLIRFLWLSSPHLLSLYNNHWTQQVSSMVAMEYNTLGTIVVFRNVAPVRLLLSLRHAVAPSDRLFADARAREASTVIHALH